MTRCCLSDVINLNIVDVEENCLYMAINGWHFVGHNSIYDGDLRSFPGIYTLANMLRLLGLEFLPTTCNNEN